MAARRKANSEPFASTALVALLVRTLHRIDASLLPAGVTPPDELAAATLPSIEKRALLQHAYGRGGAMPLLQVGESIGEMRTQPLAQALLRARDTDALATQWTRLEQYHHAQHRVHIDYSKAGLWLCTRRWSSIVPPSDAENIFIAGLMRGLLLHFGCSGVTLRVADIETSRPRSGTAQVFASQPTLSWELRWATVQPHAGGHGPAPLSADAPWVERLMQLLGDDPARVWTLAQAGQALQRSSRTLQRELQRCGHTFSSVVRAARTREAARLLAQGETALADIGYCCGYADQAHFQRDFRRAVNMTPKAYRRSAIGL